MHLIQIICCLTAITIIGCDKIRREEIPCKHNPEKICGEQVKRLVNGEWKLDGWRIERFGEDSEQFTAYREGEIKYSEGSPSHAKWYTRAKAKEFALTVFEMDSSHKTMLIKTGDKKSIYQLNFVDSELQLVFKVPQSHSENADTLFGIRAQIN